MGNSSCPEKSNVSTEAEKLKGHLKWIEEKRAELQNERMKEGIYKKVIDDAYQKFIEYKANPSVATYLSVAQAHVSLVSSCVEKFENSVEDIDSGKYKKLVEILQDTGVARNEKYQGIVLRLIDLYHEEWDLLHKTCLSMIHYKNKANRIKDIIEVVQYKILNGRKLADKQIDLVESSLSDWFSGEPEMNELHKISQEFSKIATKFNHDFTNCGIFEELKTALLKQRPQLWISIASRGMVGFFNATVNDATDDTVNSAKKIANDLESTVQTAHKISLALRQLNYQIHYADDEKQQSVKSWKDLYLDDWEKNQLGQKKVKESLAEIINTLDSFCNICDEIKIMANNRQKEYIKF